MVSKVTMDIEIQAYVDARIAESEGRSHSECEALRETFDLRLRANILHVHAVRDIHLYDVLVFKGFG